jgi:hypothetical protein
LKTIIIIKALALYIGHNLVVVAWISSSKEKCPARCTVAHNA